MRFCAFLYCQETQQAVVLFLVLNTDFHPGKDFVKENKFGVSALKKLAKCWQSEMCLYLKSSIFLDNAIIL